MITSKVYRRENNTKSREINIEELWKLKKFGENVFKPALGF